MNAKEAVAARILALCNERGIAINALAGSAGVSPLHGLQHAQCKEPEPRCGFPSEALRWAGYHPAAVFQ